MRQLKAYPVKRAGEFSLAMQRRTKVLAVTSGPEGLQIHTETEHDPDTKAFDVAHTRDFVALGESAAIPEGGIYVGTGRLTPKATVLHLYEVPKVKPKGL